MRRYSIAMLVGLATLLVPMAATAAISFQYSTTPGTDVFQQTTNNPRVIGDPSCHQPSGMFYNRQAGPPGATYDLFSTVYKAASPNNFGVNEIPTSFFIGVDDNFTVDHEYLIAFNTYTCTGPVSSANITTAGSICAGGAISHANSWNSGGDGISYSIKDMSQSTNGNGFSNFILKGFSLTAGTFYAFEAKVSNDSDGTEQFFLIPAGTPAVPEPTSILMLGTAILGIGAVARRRLRARRP